MKLFDWMDGTVFKRTTLTEIISQQTRLATLEVEQNQHVIRTHQFSLHMARATLRALEEWNAAHPPAPDEQR